MSFSRKISYFLMGFVLGIIFFVSQVVIYKITYKLNEYNKDILDKIIYFIHFLNGLFIFWITLILVFTIFLNILTKKEKKNLITHTIFLLIIIITILYLWIL